MAFKKTELNDFCQSNKIQVDGYETRQVADGFLSILKCGKTIFESSRPRPTKKEAENEVAVIALNALKRTRPRDHNNDRGQLSPSHRLEERGGGETIAQLPSSLSPNLIDPKSGQKSSPNHLIRPGVPYTAVPTNTNGGLSTQLYVLHLLTQYCQIKGLHLLHKLKDLGKGKYSAHVAIGDRIFADQTVHDDFDGAKHHVNLLALKELHVEEFLQQYYRTANIIGPAIRYPVPPTQHCFQLPYMGGAYTPVIRGPIPTNAPLMYSQVPYTQPVPHDDNVGIDNVTKQLSNITLDVAKQPLLTTPTSSDNNLLVSNSAVVNVTNNAAAVLLSPSDFKQSTAIIPPTLLTSTVPTSANNNPPPPLVTSNTGTVHMMTTVGSPQTHFTSHPLSHPSSSHSPIPYSHPPSSPLSSHSSHPLSRTPSSNATPPLSNPIPPSSLPAHPSPVIPSAMSLPTRSNLKKDKRTLPSSPVSLVSPSNQSITTTIVSTTSQILQPTPSLPASSVITSSSYPLTSSITNEPSITSEVPSVATVHAVPESEVSYKAILNEYALKHKYTLPVYTTEDPENCVGYVGVADFGGKRYKSAPDKNKKRALNLVAYEVLASLGVVSGNKPHPSTTPTTSLTISYKNQLQEYYQKKRLPLPQYVTVQTNNGKFICTVTCDYIGGKRCFKGVESSTKKVAEQTAAEIVCKTLKI